MASCCHCTATLLWQLLVKRCSPHLCPATTPLHNRTSAGLAHIQKTQQEVICRRRRHHHHHFHFRMAITETSLTLTSLIRWDMRHHHTNLCRSQQRHAMGISLVVLPMKQEAMGKSREATGYTHREVTGNQSAKCKRKNRSLWALPQFCCLPSDPSEKWSAANISHIPWVRESSIILCWDTVNIIYICIYIWEWEI